MTLLLECLLRWILLLSVVAGHSNGNGYGNNDDFWEQHWLERVDAEASLADCVLAKPAKLIVAVQSRRSNFRQREAIRESWANHSLFPDGTLCIFFAVAVEAAPALSHNAGVDREPVSGSASAYATVCPSLVSLQQHVTACNTTSATTASSSSRCKAVAELLTHCALAAERVAHSDIVPLPMLESASSQQKLAMLLRFVDEERKHVWRFGDGGHPAPDVLVVSDTDVVNLPLLFEQNMLPLATSKSARLANMNRAADAGAFDVRGDGLDSDGRSARMLLSLPCLASMPNHSSAPQLRGMTIEAASEFRLRMLRRANRAQPRMGPARDDRGCVVIPIPVLATTAQHICDTSELVITAVEVQHSPRAASQRIRDCWRQARAASDALHRSRWLLPNYVVVAESARRQAVVTVVAVVPDLSSALVLNLLSQVRDQTLQPRVIAVLVVPTASRPEEIAPVMKQGEYFDWTTVLAVDGGLSVGARRNIGMREATRLSQFVTVWDYEDIHGPELLRAQVEHLESIARQRKGGVDMVSSLYAVCGTGSNYGAGLGAATIRDLDIVTPFYSADTLAHCNYDDADSGIDHKHVMCVTLQGFQVVEFACRNHVVHTAESPWLYTGSFKPLAEVSAGVQRDFHMGLSEQHMLHPVSAKKQFYHDAMFPALPVRVVPPLGLLNIVSLHTNALRRPVVRRLAHFQRRPQVSVVAYWGTGVGDRNEALIRWLRQDSWFGQAELVFFGEGDHQQRDERMRLMAEWRCDFCEYAHRLCVDEDASTSFGRALQRGVDLAQSNFIVVVNLHPRFEYPQRSVPADRILQLWSFEIETFVTPLFLGKVEAVVHRQNCKEPASTTHGVSVSPPRNLDFARSAVGFIREARTACPFINADVDVLDLFTTCMEAEGFRVKYDMVDTHRDQRGQCITALSPLRDNVAGELVRLTRLTKPASLTSNRLGTTVDYQAKQRADLQTLRSQMESLALQRQNEMMVLQCTHDLPTADVDLETLQLPPFVRFVQILDRQGSWCRSHAASPNRQLISICAPRPPRVQRPTSSAEISAIAVIDLVSHSSAKWIVEREPLKRFTASSLLRLRGHFLADAADVVVQRVCANESSSSKPADVRLDVIAYSTAALRRCPFRYMGWGTDAKSEHFQQNTTTLFLQCVLEHEFVVLERNNCPRTGSEAPEMGTSAIAPKRATTTSEWLRNVLRHTVSRPPYRQL